MFISHSFKIWVGSDSPALTVHLCNSSMLIADSFQKAFQSCKIKPWRQTHLGCDFLKQWVPYLNCKGSITRNKRKLFTALYNVNVICFRTGEFACRQVCTLMITCCTRTGAGRVQQMAEDLWNGTEHWIELSEFHNRSTSWCYTMGNSSF